MFAPSYFGKLLGCKSHTLKQPKAVEFAFKAICSRFGHFSAESDWVIALFLDIDLTNFSVESAFFFFLCKLSYFLYGINQI